MLHFSSPGACPGCVDAGHRGRIPMRGTERLARPRTASGRPGTMGPQATPCLSLEACNSASKSQPEPCIWTVARTTVALSATPNRRDRLYGTGAPSPRHTCALSVPCCAELIIYCLHKYPAGAALWNSPVPRGLPMALVPWLSC